MADQLPPATIGDFEDGPRCPWCAADPGDAQVSVDDLLGAFTCPGRVSDEIAADCPHCWRPFKISLVERHGQAALQLRPFRTEADLALQARRK